MVLDQPGEVRWEGGVKLPAVNATGQVLNHPQTPFFRVAPGPIGVVKLVKTQYPGPVEEIVHQAVDGNHVQTHSAVVPAGVEGQEEGGHGHVGELGADIGNSGDFLYEGLEEVIDFPLGQPALPEMLPDFGVKVPTGCIPQEKIQGERHLVQSSPFHVESRDRAVPEKDGFAAAWVGFLVAAAREGLKSR